MSTTSSTAYKHLGRDDVTVKPVVIDRGSDRVDLVFEVTEGAKTPVRQINFTGNTVFGKRQLAAIIKTSATNMLSFLTRRRRLRSRCRQRRSRADPHLLSQPRDMPTPTCAQSRPNTIPRHKGFTLTFAIDEGPLYHFGDITIDCHVDGVDPEKLAPPAQRASRRAYSTAPRSTRATTRFRRELAKLGYPFARALPRSSRDATARRIDVTFAIEQGPRAYVERIDIHGNTRTRGYVIRREFDIAEGDAFNKALIDRAERRLKNAGLLQDRQDHDQTGLGGRPRHSRRRVGRNKDTGDFNISGGYSTTDGWLAEIKLGDSNFAGTGVALNSTFSYGQYARGFDLSATDPGFFGNRASAGIDLSAKQTDASPYRPTAGELRRDHADRHADHRAARRAVALFDLAAGRHARSGLAGGAALDRWSSRRRATGPQWVSAVGDTVTYSTARQPEGADQRLHRRS